MSSPVEVIVQSSRESDSDSTFIEDKDAAKKLRTEIIMPALRDDKSVIIDFRGIDSSTQSFIHALIGEPLQRFGETILERLEFRSCAPQIKSLIQLVVDYSLGGFSEAPLDVNTLKKKKRPRS